MSKPIAQTFYVNEPIGGSEGVVLTKVDIYFQSVSANYGIELQIRTTENGNPTPYRLPNASKVLHVSDTYSNTAPIIRASADASIPTTFEFDTPIVLQSQTPYALVLIPIGGNPEYTVWCGELGGTDVTTKTPIYTNNDTGTLFLSSNDIQFTPVQTEDIKFTIYTANFTATSGKAVYTTTEREHFTLDSLSGNFVSTEYMFMSNCFFDLAKLAITGNTIAFTQGEFVYQSNGTANVATGTLYYANSSTALITNATGSFTTAYGVNGNTSTATATVSSVNQNVVSYSNTTVLVPFTGNGTANLFYANQSIFVGTNNRSAVDCMIVSSVNSTAITLKSNTSFSDDNCLFGQIRGDNLSLTMRWGGPTAGWKVPKSFFIDAAGSFSTANSSSNFSNAHNQYIFGFHSKASVRVISLRDPVYTAVIPQFADSTSKSTDIQWTFSGMGSNGVADSQEIPVINNVEKEFLDKERWTPSRSTEYVSYSGNYTTRMNAYLSTANNKISPYIDNIKNLTTFVRNELFSPELTSGYLINVANSNGVIVGGRFSGPDVIQIHGSNTATGKVHFANDSLMYIGNVTGKFVPNESIYVVANNMNNVYATASVDYGEKYNDRIFQPYSRYISKNVVLADKQDAEDLKCYLTAYRPGTTDFHVYTKVVHNQDSESLNNKYWSRMVELSSPALLSSGSNPDDFVELEYGLPTSQFIANDVVTCSTTSANITISTTTAGISNGNFIYLHNTSSNTFIVRQVEYVANNTTLVLTTNPSFTSSNADIGLIPNIEDQTGAFLFANNNNIARYVSNNDVVYDSFKNFAMKIIPVSETRYIVPRAADMRCLALQV